MKQRNRLIIFITLLCIIISSIILSIFFVDYSDNNKLSFAPFFQLIGKAPQTAGRAVTKILPVNIVDEEEIGKEIKLYYNTFSSKDKYLNSLIDNIQKFKKKPFNYEVFVVYTGDLNAMALPGGVIVITNGLLNTLKSESELVAVLGHEMGHIELSHCIESMKYEILSKKLVHNNIGEIADLARNMFFSKSFSKTQEDEADDYSFQLLTQTIYDPSSIAKAFQSLSEYATEKQDINIINEYLMSHPYLSKRIVKFLSKSKAWWYNNKNEKRYIGVENLKMTIDYSKKDFGEQEWTSNFKN